MGNMRDNVQQLADVVEQYLDGCPECDGASVVRFLVNQDSDCTKCEFEFNILRDLYRILKESDDPPKGTTPVYFDTEYGTWD